MILRLFAAAVLVYAFGFLAFAVSLPKPVSGQRTDAVIVLTGGPGRIARGRECAAPPWQPTPPPPRCCGFAART